MARVPKLSSEARSRLQKHRRDLQRKSSADAVNRLQAARSEMAMHEMLGTRMAEATNENAFFNSVLSMLNAVQSSWNLSVPIHMVENWEPNVVAFTDFSTIEVRYPSRMIPKSTVGGFDSVTLRTSIADIKGIAYHEIGHILFTTPYPVLISAAADEGMIFPSTVNMPALRDYWNVLEDQRMEAALVRESPIMVDYLTTMVLNHIVANSRHGTVAQWLLLTGRRYTPRHIRIEMKKEFANTFGIDAEREGTRIVRSYMTATTASQMATAVLDFYNFFQKLGLSCPPNVDKHPHHRSGATSSETYKERIISSADPSDDDTGDDTPQDSMSESKPSAEGDDSSDESGGGAQDSDTSDSSSGDSQGVKSDDGSNTLDSSPSAGDGDAEAPNDQSNGESDSSSESNPGDGVSRQGNEDIKQFIERMANEANEKRLQDSSLDATVRDVYTSTADELSLPKNRNTLPMYDPNMAVEAMTLAQRLEESLHTYLADTAPIWQNRQSRGIIDPFAYRTKSGGSQEYRRLYDNGDVGNDMAVTVMLDVSGSMYGQNDALGACAYATKAACMSLDVPCTITTFSHSSEILWTAQEQPELVSVQCNGGTNPTGVLDVLEGFSYDKTNHLVVVMTDGMFDSAFKGFNRYKTGNRYFLGLGFGDESIVIGLQRSHADEAHRITNLMEIPQIVSNFIATRLN